MLIQIKKGCYGMNDAGYGVKTSGSGILVGKKVGLDRKCTWLKLFYKRCKVLF